VLFKTDDSHVFFVFRFLAIDDSCSPHNHRKLKLNVILIQINVMGMIMNACQCLSVHLTKTEYSLDKTTQFCVWQPK